MKINGRFYILCDHVRRVYHHIYWYGGGHHELFSTGHASTEMVQTGNDISARLVPFIRTDQSDLFYTMDYSIVVILAMIR